MISIFDMINSYQDGIVATVSVAIGTAQAGICSWSLHRLIQDEQFLIFIVGHAMYKITKNLQEAMAHYSTVREHLHQDLFQVIFVNKIALSLVLVSSLCLATASIFTPFFKNKSHARLLWIVVGFASILGFIGGFTLGMRFLVQNILYLQIFLAATGVNILILGHLLIAVAVKHVYVATTTKRSNSNSAIGIEAGESARNENKVMKPILVTHNEAQTPSISLIIQEEFPLPPSPPSPIPVPSPRPRTEPNATSSTINDS